MNNIKNNRLLRLIAFFAIIFVVNIFSMRMSETGKSLAKRWLGQEQKNLVGNKKGLLIFLDDSEKGRFGAVGYDLLTALYQEAGPIIASASLLYTLLEFRKNDMRPIDIIVNEINEDGKIWWKTTDLILKNNIEDSVNKRQNVLISRIGFKPERWIIKKINNSLNLLIPHSYLESLNIDKNKVEEFDNTPNITSDIELKLGLKVNHMETINYESTSTSISYYKRFLSYFSQSVSEPILFLVDYFNDSLESIFCKKSDYKNKKIDDPKWFICIMGHGEDYYVASLSFGNFKQWLHFLDSKIDTQLLVVTSCYAMGMNANKIYGELKSEAKQYYSFPIIIKGLNDIVVTTKMVFFDFSAWKDQNKKIQLTTHVDFISFFKKVKELDDNYSEVIKPITVDSIENTPQIKLPGLEWFSVIELDKKIASIGSTLVKTRDPQKPLDVVSFFKKDPEIILLYTNDIPFELAINSSNLKAIVSMAPKLMSSERFLHSKGITYFAFQKIKKISSTALTFRKIVELFKTVSISLQETSWVFIDEIRDSSDIINKDILIFGTRAEGMRIYFKDKDDVLFTGNYKEDEEIKFEKVESNSKDETDYNDRMRVIYYQELIWSEETKQEITPEQIKKIENVLIKQREEQKHEKK